MASLYEPVRVALERCDWYDGTVESASKLGRAVMTEVHRVDRKVHDKLSSVVRSELGGTAAVVGEFMQARLRTLFSGHLPMPTVCYLWDQVVLSVGWSRADVFPALCGAILVALVPKFALQKGSAKLGVLLMDHMKTLSVTALSQVVQNFELSQAVNRDVKMGSAARANLNNTLPPWSWTTLGSTGSRRQSLALAPGGIRRRSSVTLRGDGTLQPHEPANEDVFNEQASDRIGVKTTPTIARAHRPLTPGGETHVGSSKIEAVPKASSPPVTSQNAGGNFANRRPAPAEKVSMANVELHTLFLGSAKRTLDSLDLLLRCTDCPSHDQGCWTKLCFLAMQGHPGWEQGRGYATAATAGKHNDRSPVIQVCVYCVVVWTLDSGDYRYKSALSWATSSSSTTTVSSSSSAAASSSPAPAAADLASSLAFLCASRFSRDALVSFFCCTSG